jgi:uncharacterized membrane protein YfcA
MIWLIATFAAAGGAAQIVDGTLGMGFGVTSASLLLGMGVGAAAASASTHLAKLPTTLVSGLAHWKRGNVDRQVLVRTAIPGGIGSFLGAVVLVDISLDAARPAMATLLLCLGCLILLRFGFRKNMIPASRRGRASKRLGALGAVAGFTDSMGGGGWGPLMTPSVLMLTTYEPRRVVGTVNAAEFLVALCASIGFLFRADKVQEHAPAAAVLGLIGGGLVVAPFAARLAGCLPSHVMGTLVGGALIVVNLGVICEAVAAAPSLGLVLSVPVGAGILLAAWRAHRWDAARAAQPRSPTPGLSIRTTDISPRRNG